MNKYGGIWLDTDVLVMNNFDDLFEIFEENEGFFLCEDKTKIFDGIIGSKKQTQCFKNLLQKIMSGYKTYACSQPHDYL